MTSLYSTAERAAFERLHLRHGRAVLAFCLRRSTNPADAEETAAETFVIAWRRLSDAPREDHEIAWLYAIARRVLANQRRASERRVRLLDRLRIHASQTVPTTPVASGGLAIEALTRLGFADQELLRLVAWEGLSHAEIAVVLGISTNAVAIRLHRARRTFEQELLKGSGPSRTSRVVKGRMFGRRRREHLE